MKSWIKSPVKIKRSASLYGGLKKPFKKNAVLSLAASFCIFISILSINSCSLLKTQDSIAVKVEETAQDENSKQISAGTTLQPASPEESTVISSQDKNTLLFYSIETKKISRHDSEKLTDIIAEYPYLSSSTDQELADYVNRLIYHEIIGWWILEFEEAAEEAAGFLPAGEKRPMGTDIGYAIEYSDNLAVSIVFTSFSYLGGAHGNVVTATCNYDFTDNKEILLSDLFSWESNYTVFLSEYCRNAIKKHFTEADIDPGSFEDMILNGTNPDEPDNFRKFNISEDALIIRFDQYDVAPYAMGPVVVEIPYNSMADILYPGGIIEKILD